MRYSELSHKLNEITLDPNVDKEGIRSDAELQADYDFYTKQRRTTYQIPELPNHIAHVIPTGQGVDVFLLNKESGNPIAVVVLEKTPVAYKVDHVQVKNEYQRYGIGSTLYKFMILTLGFTLQSDDTQSNAGSKLWAKLARTPGIQVFAYNESAHKAVSVYYDQETERLNTKDGKLYGDKSYVLIVRKSK